MVEPSPFKRCGSGSIPDGSTISESITRGELRRLERRGAGFNSQDSDEERGVPRRLPERTRSKRTMKVRLESGCPSRLRELSADVVKWHHSWLPPSDCEFESRRPHDCLSSPVARTLGPYPRSVGANPTRGSTALVAQRLCVRPLTEWWWFDSIRVREVHRKRYGSAPGLYPGGRGSTPWRCSTAC